jgi:glycosyltransferase involved in cell wall biosynthesis
VTGGGPPDAAARRALIVGRMLSAAPPVLATATYPRQPLAPVAAFARSLGDRPGASLVFVYHSLEAGSLRRTLPAHYHAIAAASPSHRVIILCNTAAEVALMRAAGVAAEHCNHNLLVDERVFDLRPGLPRDFDAIYIARMRRYKRHELARGIARLALITSGPEDSEPDYAEAVRAALPRATVINAVLARQGYGDAPHARAAAVARALFAARGHVVLRPETVAEYCNRARVGLCLSAREGAMFASMEYLLCGLPVVSTENAGGRDHFFDADYCVTVPPDAAAVAAAVAAVARRAVAAPEIRARTLARVAAERAALRAVVADVLAGLGARAGLEAAWSRLFSGRWSRLTTLDALLAEL